MKLHEEFKLYETMWDEPTGIIAIVYAGDFRNEDRLEQEAAKAKPVHTIVTNSFTDFIRQYTNVIDKTHIKLYTDAEGKAELENACVDMPVNMKKEIFSAVTLLEWHAANSHNKTMGSSTKTSANSAIAQTIDAKKIYVEIFEAVDYEVDGIKIDSYDNSYDIGTEMHYELQWNLKNDPEDPIDIDYYKSVLKISLDQLLKSKGYDTIVKIDIDFDIDTLSYANVINLTISYNLPYKV